MFKTEYFVHSLAHASKVAKYDVVSNVTETSHEAIAYIETTMRQRCVWDNDGFNAYVRFRVTDLDTGSSAIVQYTYYDHLRTYTVTVDETQGILDQGQDHTCVIQETPDGMGCVTCLYT